MSAPTTKTPQCPPADTSTCPPAKDPTTVDVCVGTKDAGLTADVNVVNLNALGLLNDGIDVGLHADLSLLGCTPNVGVDACVSIDTPSLCDVGDCLPVACLPDLDVCSLTQHLGV
jgi:hypothetical protein